MRYRECFLIFIFAMLAEMYKLASIHMEVIPSDKHNYRARGLKCCCSEVLNLLNLKI